MNCHDVYRVFTCNPPYPEQAELFDKLWSLEPGSPLLVRLPCGYGKTEGAVLPFLAQALADDWRIAPRLIYVLPTRALCNQIAERITRYARKASAKLRVTLEHGAALFDPLFFADICVTTFDQFLYGYARAKPQVGRHLDLPAGAIANSIVVFDEAHLYSPYTHALMRAMIEILAGARVPVVLMTATMPGTLQDDLLKDSLRSEPIAFRGNWPGNLGKRNVLHHIEEWGLLENEKTASASLIGLLDKHQSKRVLVVANRVDVARRLAEDLREQGRQPILIHSRFTVDDRAAKEKLMLGLLDREADRGRPALVISTQVCEVGLDISCDVLITECASADALVQRVGRVARWGGEGHVVIVKPDMPYPYYDRNRATSGPDQMDPKADLTEIARTWLENHRGFRFTDWEATCEFCDEMKYRTDDIAARGALGQLFDATLYADERPWNLSARGDLYCTLADVASEKPTYGEIKGKTLNVPFLWLRRNAEKARFEELEYEDGKFKPKEGSPAPFKLYRLNRKVLHYDSNLGLRFKDARDREASRQEEGCVCL